MLFSFLGSPGIELFVFHGRTNRALKVNEPGEIHGEVTTADKDGRWTFLNDEKRLIIGDVINYWIYVQHNGLGYRLDNQQFTVRAFNEEVQQAVVILDKPLPPPIICELSETTKANGVTVCKGSVIFEDHFETVDYAKWEPVTIFSSEYEDAEFNTYQNRTDNYYVKNGMLVIAPTLQQDVPGFNASQIRSGKLDFGARCTIDVLPNNPRDCVRQGRGAYILPPVVSAKLRTKRSLTFRYGEITVRAKVPKGDWLFPEFYLESADRVYGPHFFASGQMRMGFVRGNSRLTFNGNDIDGTQLSGVLVLVNPQEKRSKWTRTTQSATHWGDDFHNYTLTWTPQAIRMSVDGLLYANFRDPFCAQPGNCEKIPHSEMWKRGGPLAPFDQNFYISLGVGVGGLGDFPDGALNGVGGRAKPWENTDPQSERLFYADLNNWKATWTDQSMLQVDYIKVTAL